MAELHIAAHANLLVCACCVSGYFLAPDNLPHNPTAAALKRATWTSLGSIALGSLIISIVKAVRAVVQQAVKSERGCAMHRHVPRRHAGEGGHFLQHIRIHAGGHLRKAVRQAQRTHKDTWRTHVLRRLIAHFLLWRSVD